MHIEVNSNGSIQMNQARQEQVRATLEAELERYDDFLTRIEVHISDENAGKSGAQDKRCQIEARMKHHQPLSVTHKADALNLAVDGATEKMGHALGNLIGRLRQ